MAKKTTKIKTKFVELSAVIWKEGKWYVVNCPQLGVASQGRTVEEAKKNIQEAVELYLEKDKEEIRPLPTTRPLYTSFVVKLSYS